MKCINVFSQTPMRSRTLFRSIIIIIIITVDNYAVFKKVNWGTAYVGDRNMGDRRNLI